MNYELASGVTHDLAFGRIVVPPEEGKSLR
jgi:hypothetical protein